METTTVAWWAATKVDLRVDMSAATMAERWAVSSDASTARYSVGTRAVQTADLMADLMAG